MLKSVIVTIILVVLGIPTFFFSYAGYKRFDAYLNQKQVVVVSESEQEAARKKAEAAATRACKVADVAEAAAGWNDQVLAAKAMARMESGALSACNIFSKYLLLRAPSQVGGPMAIREPGVVLAKAKVSSAWVERIASAYTITDAAIRGEFNLVFKESEDPADRELELKWRRALECNQRLIRVWVVGGFNVNSAGTDKVKMKNEMGDEFESPSGTRHFCPKKTEKKG